MTRFLFILKENQAKLSHSRISLYGQTNLNHAESVLITEKEGEKFKFWKCFRTLLIVTSDLIDSYLITKTNGSKKDKPLFTFQQQTGFTPESFLKKPEKLKNYFVPPLLAILFLVVRPQSLQ